MIKITGHSPENLQENIERVMNLACVAFRRGAMPSDYDIDTAATRGLFWTKVDGIYHLLPTANNAMAFVREYETAYVVIEFHYRYDSDRKHEKALDELMAVFFDCVSIV